MTRRVLILILLLFIPVLARAQGQQIIAGPYPNSGLLYVCPVPSGGTPCPSPVSIFSNIGLTTGISNPIVAFAQQTYTFYVAGGQQYTLEMPASGVQQIVGGGGGSNVPGQFNVRNAPYNAKGDARVTTDCVTTANSPIVTSALANWQPSDVGKIFIATSHVSNASNLTGVNEATIVSRQSATQVTLSVNAINTLSGEFCVWATQDDTNAFLAAVTAASTATSQIAIGSANARIDNYPGTVFIPVGGYIVNSQLINCQPLSSGGLCPSFVGGNLEQTVLYIAPGLTTPLLEWINASGIEIGNFSITTMNSIVSAGCGGFACGLIWLSGDQKFRIHDINGRNIGFSNSGGAVVYLVNISGAHSTMEKVTFAAGAGTAPWLGLTNVAEFSARDLFLSNSSVQNLSVTSSTTRNATDNPILFENVSSDECGAAPCARIIASGINWVGGGVFGEGGASGAMSVDGTSAAWLTDLNIGSFTTLNNNVGLNIAAGGVVYATMDTIRGNGTSAAVSGTSTSVFNDVGGNQIQNCSNTTCTNVTAAQYATLGFTGGIVPKATVTHTPNTCYAVTGNLLATAQNLCTPPMDQNYQVVAVSAQSGGTTPANSSCATPPVITLSDGTRSFTMTMTSGKTQWSSSVDAVTNLNQVFASGTTLTISIGANTCATPPSNVSVTYNLQSVLNP